MIAVVEAGADEVEPVDRWRTFEPDGTATLRISGTVGEVKAFVDQMRTLGLFDKVNRKNPQRAG